ncbi:MAG: glycosyltransferase, partial [Crocinitomicaceae bacterium]|nr:glycosyltransferase [Crocinitomicaceae bacterium]
LLHIITTIDPGGAEKQLLVLVKEQIEQGLRVTVLPLKGSNLLAKSFEAIGAEVLLSTNFGKPKFFFQVLMSIRRSNFDIVHCHLPRAEVMGALCKILNKEICLVITRHNIETFIPYLPVISSPLSRLVTKRANALISISNAVSNFLESRNEVTRNIKIFRIYYGFPLPKDKSQSLIFEQKEKTCQVIGIIARLENQKNIDLLLKACSMMPDNLNWNLRIVGIGNEKSRLQTLANSLCIDQKIEWLGTILDIDKFLSAIDTFVLPSKYEGFGLVLLEAMQLGVPIVASDAPAIPEVLGVDYELLFESGNATELRNKLLESFSINTRDLVRKKYPELLKKFDPRLMAKTILEVYQTSQINPNV